MMRGPQAAKPRVPPATLAPTQRQFIPLALHAGGIKSVTSYYVLAAMRRLCSEGRLRWQHDTSFVDLNDDGLIR